MIVPTKSIERLETHHCVTGSMLRLYRYYDHPISEEMLFGLGEGTGFIYWHQKGQMPFFGGRANPKPSLEELAAQRTGVQITSYTTSSARKAEKDLLTYLEDDIPVLLQVDMGYLPYFDFGGEEYHFGGHVIVAIGYDAASDSILVADRDTEIHTVPREAVAQARGSTHKPFPPKNRLLALDFSTKRQPTEEEILVAISNQTAAMLNPPISNLGIKGIHKTAKMLPTWANLLSEQELRETMFNAYIFISPVGGTGGGTFRYMFSRFLAEVAPLTSRPELASAAQAFAEIGDSWAELGDWFQQVSEAPAPAARLKEAVDPLQRLAGLEEAAWNDLAQLS